MAKRFVLTIGLLGLACCSRSGFSDVAKLRIVGVAVPNPVVHPGERLVPVVVTLQNGDSNPVEVTRVELIFRRGASNLGQYFDVVRDADNPEEVAGDGETEFAFWVDVSGDAPPGEVDLDATALLQLPDGSTARLYGADDTGRLQILGEALVALVRVSAEAAEVVPGDLRVPVRLQVQNLGSGEVEILEAGLRFLRDTQDVTSDYLVTPEEGNPDRIAAGGTVDLTLLASVSVGAARGEITLDGWLRACLVDGAALRFAGAQQTDSWVVLETGSDLVLVVTVVDDEDDTGGIPSVAAAGGGADLSLREALLIANAAAEPQTVRFDPAMFPDGVSTDIQLKPELDRLVISRAGTRIDGSNTGESIGISGELNVLFIQADDVTLQDVAFRDSAITCVVADFLVDRVHLSGCTFYGSRNGVHMQGGDGHSISGCRLERLSGYGMILQDQVRNLQVSDNQFLSVSYGLALSGEQVQVFDNVFQSASNWSIKCEGCRSVLFRNNSITGSGGSVYTDDYDVGLLISYQNLDVRIEANTFTGSMGHAIRLNADVSSGITITRNTFEDNGGLPISLFAESNQGLLPPAITAFDGLIVSGTAAVDGTVEVYSLQPVELYTYLGSCPVSQGSWSLDLGAPYDAVCATVTTPEGSTSEFSAATRR